MDEPNAPVCIAINHGKLDIAKHLIDNCGAWLNSLFNLERPSPVRVAISKGFIDFTDYLLDKERGGWIECTQSYTSAKGVFGV